MPANARSPSAAAIRLGTRFEAGSVGLSVAMAPGRPAPSKEDIKVTQHLMLCGDIMEIPVLDHVILGDNLFYSYKENKVRRIKL